VLEDEVAAKMANKGERLLVDRQRHFGHIGASGLKTSATGVVGGGGGADAVLSGKTQC